MRFWHHRRISKIIIKKKYRIVVNFFCFDFPNARTDVNLKLEPTPKQQ